MNWGESEVGDVGDETAVAGAFVGPAGGAVGAGEKGSHCDVVWEDVTL